MGTGGNVGSGGNGVSASQGGTSPSGGDSGGGYYSTHDITGFGTNGIGGPNAVGSTGVLNNGLAAGPGDHAGFQGGYENVPGQSIADATRAIEKELGFAPGTYASYANPANFTSNFASLLGGPLSGGGTSYGGGGLFGRSYDNLTLASNPGNDVGGFFGRGGILGTGLGGWDVARMLGSAALSVAGTPLAGIGFNLITSLLEGNNPGAVAGGFAGSQLGGLIGGSLPGPAGLITGPLGGQLGGWLGGQAGASAMANGYSAPASQGPAATGGNGGALARGDNGQDYPTSGAATTRPGPLTNLATLLGAVGLGLGGGGSNPTAQAVQATAPLRFAQAGVASGAPTPAPIAPRNSLLPNPQASAGLLAASPGMQQFAWSGDASNPNRKVYGADQSWLT